MDRGESGIDLLIKKAHQCIPKILISYLWLWSMNTSAGRRRQHLNGSLFLQAIFLPQDSESTVPLWMSKDWYVHQSIIELHFLSHICCVFIYYYYFFYLIWQSSQLLKEFSHYYKVKRWSSHIYQELLIMLHKSLCCFHSDCSSGLSPDIVEVDMDHLPFPVLKTDTDDLKLLEKNSSWVHISACQDIFSFIILYDHLGPS